MGDKVQADSDFLHHRGILQRPPCVSCSGSSWPAMGNHLTGSSGTDERPEIVPEMVRMIRGVRSDGLSPPSTDEATAVVRIVQQAAKTFQHATTGRGSATTNGQDGTPMPRTNGTPQILSARVRNDNGPNASIARPIATDPGGSSLSRDLRVERCGDQPQPAHTQPTWRSSGSRVCCNGSKDVPRICTFPVKRDLISRTTIRTLGLLFSGGWFDTLVTDCQEPSNFRGVAQLG
jgi:hypothetical protein